MSIKVDLTGEVALVTGASSGLGAHFATLLAASGAKVALAARRLDRLATLAAQIEARGGRALPVECDVTIPASVAAAVSAAETELGPVTILVNNSGVVASKKALEHSEDDWDHVLDTNLKGAFLVATEVARHLAALGRGGTIVNIASILGLRNMARVASYSASKAGLIHLTRALAMEWARHDIRVNAICPGYIETEMNSDFWKTPGGQRLIERIPQRRIGQPEHLDGALLLLASDSGRFITGAVLPVDGGHLVVSI